MQKKRLSCWVVGIKLILLRRGTVARGGNTGITIQKPRTSRRGVSQDDDRHCHQNSRKYGRCVSAADLIR